MGGSPQRGEVPSLPRITVTMVEFGVCATYTLVHKPCALVHLTLREVEGGGVVDQGIPPCSGDANQGNVGGSPQGVISTWRSGWCHR